MHNVINFKTPYERIKDYASCPEAALFKAIIVQNMTDATNISKKPEDKLIEKEAKEWIYGNHKDFQMICHYADLDPMCVIAVTKRAVELNAQKHGVA